MALEFWRTQTTGRLIVRNFSLVLSHKVISIFGIQVKKAFSKKFQLKVIFIWDRRGDETIWGKSICWYHRYAKKLAYIGLYRMEEWIVLLIVIYIFVRVYFRVFLLQVKIFGCNRKFWVSELTFRENMTGTLIVFSHSEDQGASLVAKKLITGQTSGLCFIKHKDVFT